MTKLKLNALPLLLLLLLTAAGCPLNPVHTAQTVEQKADAIYGEYVIAKEQGAALLNDATIPDTAKRPLAEAMVSSKATADSLHDALGEYSKVKSQLAAGTTSNDKLVIAEQNLSTWLAESQPLIQKLIDIVGGIRK